MGYKASDNSRVFIPDISNNLSKANKFLGYDDNGVLTTYTSEYITSGYHSVNITP